MTTVWWVIQGMFLIFGLWALPTGIRRKDSTLRLAGILSLAGFGFVVLAEFV